MTSFQDRLLADLCISVLMYRETLSSVGRYLSKSLCLSQDNVLGLLSGELSLLLSPFLENKRHSSLSEEMVGFPTNNNHPLMFCSQECTGGKGWCLCCTTGLLSMEKLGTGAHSAHGSNSVVFCEESLI